MGKSRLTEGPIEGSLYLSLTADEVSTMSGKRLAKLESEHITSNLLYSPEGNFFILTFHLHAFEPGSDEGRFHFKLYPDGKVFGTFNHSTHPSVGQEQLRGSHTAYRNEIVLDGLGERQGADDYNFCIILKKLTNRYTVKSRQEN